MARRAIGISSKWLKYIPQIAAFYALYEYYASNGLDGIRADLEALTFDGIKAQLKNVLTGFGAFLLGDAIAAQISDRYVKVVIRSVAYYVGTKQLAAALDVGSTVSRIKTAETVSNATISASVPSTYSMGY